MPADIPLGYWRSVGESYNTFAIESAIDEVAQASGVNPLTLRRTALANDARALAVIDAVDQLSGYTTTALPAGTGKGLAFLKGFGSYIALVLHVTGTAAAIRVVPVVQLPRAVSGAGRDSPGAASVAVTRAVPEAGYRSNQFGTECGLHLCGQSSQRGQRLVLQGGEHPYSGVFGNSANMRHCHDQGATGDGCCGSSD